MKMRLSLYVKIVLWVLLNMVLVVTLIIGLVGLRYRFNPDRFIAFTQSVQFDLVSRMIAEELREATLSQRQEILRRYAAAWKVDLMLLTPRGERLAGSEMAIPDEVSQRLHNSPFGAGMARNRVPGEIPGGHGVLEPIAPPPDQRPPPPPEPFGGGGEAPNQRLPRRPPGFLIKTSNPTRYWAGSRIPIIDRGLDVPVRGAVLVAVSDSFTGNGLFFDLKPLLVLAGVVLLTSMVIWFPFVRRITGSIKLLTQATEQIANEKFEVRVPDNRGDELGRLGKAVNHLAERLNGFVRGQKRFLGDISHELNSPLARMQFALGILEERSEPGLRPYVEDVREEVVLMSQLVSELLAYARTGLKGVEIHLGRVGLRSIVDKVISREAEGRAFRIEIPENIEVTAQAELLTRAIANIIRNAIRYAGESGEITIRAHQSGSDLPAGRATTPGEDGGSVVLSVIDQGPGIPDEMLDRIFDPFYRIEPDRNRATGGTGLGLAIVRTCIEACGGMVSAHNHHPGLEIRIVLRG